MKHRVCVDSHSVLDMASITTLGTEVLQGVPGNLGDFLKI